MNVLCEGAAPSQVRETPGGLGRPWGRERIRNQAPPGEGQNSEAAHAENDSDHRLRGGGCISHIQRLRVIKQVCKSGDKAHQADYA